MSLLLIHITKDWSIYSALLHYSKRPRCIEWYLNRWSCSLRYNSDALDALYELQRNIIPSISQYRTECNWKQQQNDYYLNTAIYSWHKRGVLHKKPQAIVIWNQGWAWDVNGRDKTETLASPAEMTLRTRHLNFETRRLQVSRLDRDVEMHIVFNAVVNKLTSWSRRYCHRVYACFMVYSGLVYLIAVIMYRLFLCYYSLLVLVDEKWPDQPPSGITHSLSSATVL